MATLVNPIIGASITSADIRLLCLVDQVGKPIYPNFTDVTKTFVNAAASGTNQTVVAAVTGKIIRVLAVAMICGASATTVTFNSATLGAISALFACAANGGAALAFNPYGWFETIAGEALTYTTGTGSTVGIQVIYELV